MLSDLKFSVVEFKTSYAIVRKNVILWRSGDGDKRLYDIARQADKESSFINMFTVDDDLNSVNWDLAVSKSMMGGYPIDKHTTISAFRGIAADERMIQRDLARTTDWANGDNLELLCKADHVENGTKYKVQFMFEDEGFVVENMLELAIN